jgi:hypothetical protein
MIKADNTFENLIDSTKLSLFTLFTVDEQHANITLEEAKKLL